MKNLIIAILVIINVLTIWQLGFNQNFIDNRGAIETEKKYINQVKDLQTKVKLSSLIYNMRQKRGSSGLMINTSHNK